MGSDAKVSKKEKKAAQFKAQKSGGKRGSKGSATAVSDLPENDLLDDNGQPVHGQGVGEDGEREEESVVSSIKKGKRKEKSAPASAEKEDAAVADEVQEAEKAKKPKKSKKGNNEASEETLQAIDAISASKSAVTGEKQSKKRKRTEEDATDKKALTAKRTTFGDDGEAEAVEEVKRRSALEAQGDGKKATSEKGKEDAVRKYIVFVGNMSYKTKSEEIAAHFASHCGEKPTVRLLTTKADPNALANLSKSKQKSLAKGKASHAAQGGVSKGCAFVEFTSTAALQKALSFHHTAFAGRQINVELTAGGGGKTAQRTEKIQKKNERLDKERQKLHDKYIAPAAKEAKAKKASAAAGPPPSKKARMGADEAAAEGTAQWGRRSSGAGSRTGAKPMPKWMASGANAVRLQG
ncbi:hypothetical protein K437DRAFT_296491 [Tilletiaria anomala UBC 951]|uniref:RRM domain-containing protein n=1 Tax=Tilletiaria anomala (strain ATCC 24038 / CBS 436.72 / UBC 951) TaxID=1037660 RepID=A0A066VGD6_TILAU|nr:uncharacterized protein K437DRAFT_296491 [Tilletiaria anomala UBC 951]KDN37814.1 hypothetical protein K437DRAFT_296491 [Tilletiaria anomala UBC 951]